MGGLTWLDLDDVHFLERDSVGWKHASHSALYRTPALARG
ncbi:MAG: hypothetical protein JWP92_1883 [Caulobacter sp.]|nr:hypothetical protein [Caulobacter sp.]